MALATSCAQIRHLRERDSESGQVHLQTFIVDHKARPESTKEAQQVKLWLHQHLGLLPFDNCLLSDSH